ncbi:MAG: hypothetical protein JKY41_13645 [Rhodobacteraceae bacterium]|nr:hypothetical protein [Paracoccaceae bacterium]
MSIKDSQNYLPPEEAKNMLLNTLVDFAENDAENLFKFFEHVGFDVPALHCSKQIPAAWLGHYRIGLGTYDTDRALLDLMTWPPISRRLFELQQAKQSRV